MRAFLWYGVVYKHSVFFGLSTVFKSQHGHFQLYLLTLSELPNLFEF